MLDQEWNDRTATDQQIDWRKVDLVAERLGALPDAPLVMPIQSLRPGLDLGRQPVWLWLRSALTARAGH